MHVFRSLLHKLKRFDAVVYTVLAFAAPLFIYSGALALINPKEQQALTNLIWDPLAGGSTLLVYTLAVIGGNVAAWRAIAAHRKEQAALRFCRTQIQHHAKGQRQLNNLENEFLLSRKQGTLNGTLSSTELMISRLYDAALLLRYEPSNIVLASYVGAITTGSRRIKAWQTLGIRLGILGTFVGLILALVPVAQLFSSGAASLQPDAAVSIVGSILQSLSIAFGTSISGLLAAVLLQLQAGAIRDREDQLLFEMEDMVGELQKIFMKAVNDTTIGLTMSNLQREMNDHKISLSRTENGILAAKDGLERTINEQAAVLNAERASIEKAAGEQVRHIDRLGATYQAMAAIEQKVIELFSGQIDRSLKLQAEMMEALRGEIRISNQATAQAIQDGFSGMYRDALDAKVQGTLDQLIHGLKESSMQHAQVFDQRMQHYLSRQQQGGSGDVARALSSLQRALQKSQQRNWLWLAATTLMAVLLIALLVGAAAVVLLLTQPDIRARAAELLLRT